MNKAQAHPAEDELLLFLDGELDSTGLTSVKLHLDSCWTCRMRAANVQAAILEYARERDRSVIPQPPRPWRDLTDDFRRVRDSGESPSLFKRLRTGAIFRNSRVALFCGAATAIAAVSWVILPRESKNTNRPARVFQTSVATDSAPHSPAATPILPRATGELRNPDLPKNHEAVPLRNGSTTVHDELAVVAELHRLKADLGEPIALEHIPDGRLALGASGLGPDRQQEIRTALSRFPDLKINFGQPGSSSKGAGLESPATQAVRPIAFEHELARYAGGSPALQKLADSVLEASDLVSMYAHAIANLDKRFSPPSQASMDADDQKLLHQIRADYRSGARTSAESLQKQLEPIFRTLNIEPKAALNGNLLAVALRADRLVNAAFAGAQSDLSDRDLYAELGGQLARLMELVK
jgi:hypothetical protein